MIVIGLSHKITKWRCPLVSFTSIPKTGVGLPLNWGISFYCKAPSFETFFCFCFHGKKTVLGLLRTSFCKLVGFHLFWLPSFEPVWQWAGKQKSSRWPFSLFLVQFSFWRVENIRQGLKFLFHPSKRKFDPKQWKLKAGDYFESITLFQRRSRTERPDFRSLLSI